MFRGGEAASHAAGVQRERDGRAPIMRWGSRGGEGWAWGGAVMREGVIRWGRTSGGGKELGFGLGLTI